MIETVADLLKLLHRWKSHQKVFICHRGESVQLSAVTRADDGNLILETVKQDREPDKKKKNPQPANPDVAEALEQCDHILTLCDEVEGRGESFAADISEKVQGVRDWIETNDHVTEKQLSALQGWEAGVSKWLE